MIVASRLAAVLCCVLLGATAVRADEKEARAFAQQQFQRGKALYQSHDYPAALEAFRAGFQRYPLRGFLVNIGQCHRRLNEYEDSAAAYRQFLAGAGVSEALRREVREALVEVETHLEKQPPPPREPRATPEVTEIKNPATEQRVRERPIAAVDDTLAQTPPIPTPKPKRRWVWAVVGTTIGVVIAGAVTAGVLLGTRNDSPGGGSLGLVDGRTR